MAIERLLWAKCRPAPLVVSNLEDDDDQKRGRPKSRSARCGWEPSRDDVRMGEKD